MYKDSNGWIDAYRQKGAYWKHSGAPAAPHARLTSENHSNGFFNSRLIIEDEDLLRHAADDLLELFWYAGGNLASIDCVVGPATGATKLAQFISEDVEQSRQYGRCFSLSPIKHEASGNKSMLFSPDEASRLRNKFVLHVEDVVTTGLSIDLAVQATANAGGKALPYILTLVNRSGMKEISGKKILALVEVPMPIWTPDECPLCKAGSKALRPKDNWAALNAVPVTVSK